MIGSILIRMMLDEIIAKLVDLCVMLQGLGLAGWGYPIVSVARQHGLIRLEVDTRFR